MSKQEGNIKMPGAFGGIVRYDEEYNSRFMLSPTQVMVIVGIVIILVLGLKIFLPVSP